MARLQTALSLLIASTALPAFAATPKATPQKAPSLVEIPSAPENNPSPATPQACTSIDADAARLACYDVALGRQVNVPTATQNDNKAKAITVTQTKDVPLSTAINPFDAANQSTTPITPTTSLLDRRWELSPESKLGTFTLRAHKPLYILPIFYNNNPNTTPSSPNPLNTVTKPLNIDDAESKFQFSLKTKALENIFGNNGDLWLGYTQTSRWQVYNAEDSRPFRETNYEPEASLIFRTNYNFLGLDGRLLGLTLDHQSNGRALPLSRSWNRAILNIGLERGDWVVMLRPWYRIPESKADDDNPDISNYLGRGDLQITRKWNNQEFSLMLRHSLKTGDKSHGAAQLDWTFPLQGNLRGFVQVFNGYGESLIDYNHQSTYVGLGVSLLNWY
ncbi:phospholipase A [Aquirhabdus parva]|uniref:Phospholipase A1 n=1 Tax=Aquirhabdus parva TaxID=2283318 RepID=A0A345P8G9_9GAMM|nr:phospholipase A [Aquirhabdus parva]AXI03578.1 phospholipase [Aquirhabdus parva]